MKRFHLTRYKLYSEKHAGLKLAVISDVHLSSLVPNQKLTAIINRLRDLAPDYVLIPGDLVDSNNALDSKKEQTRYLKWLEKLATVAPVLLAYGNHEFLRKTELEYVRDFNRNFWTQVAALPGVTILDNEASQDKNLYVVGLTLPEDYYGENATFAHPTTEDKPTLLDFLNAQQSLLTNLPSGKLKIALVHSPVYLKDPAVKKHFAEFDYLIAGHMHGGVVPPVLNELWSSDQGIIAPGRRLFPKNARFTLKKYSDKLIVAGAVTTFGECSTTTFLNALYPTELMLLEFKNAKKYSAAPEHQYKYLSW